MCGSLCYFGLTACLTALLSALYFAYGFFMLKFRNRLLPAKGIVVTGNAVTTLMFFIVFAEVTHKGVLSPNSIPNESRENYTVLVPGLGLTDSYVCPAHTYFTALVQVVLWSLIILLAIVVNLLKQT
ncbi:ORF115-like protein [Bufonid herpesvirus 1]|uniref:ORF115-like protein n=1 Tax=Bufonid herpesvirus 1 TaxID=2282206 RepID=UPI000EB61CDF|nr:ORF115-like protein [Bufonid herpesvirus 1]AXF48552.1 ORF115-like protein [Bufonid herpesvirus 1]